MFRPLTSGSDESTPMNNPPSSAGWYRLLDITLSRLAIWSRTT